MVFLTSIYERVTITNKQHSSPIYRGVYAIVYAIAVVFIIVVGMVLSAVVLPIAATIRWLADMTNDERKITKLH